MTIADEFEVPELYKICHVLSLSASNADGECFFSKLNLIKREQRKKLLAHEKRKITDGFE